MFFTPRTHGKLVTMSGTNVSRGPFLNLISWTVLMQAESNSKGILFPKTRESNEL